MSSIKIIAEIGINHDGSCETARALIEAVAGRTWGVKFQYRDLSNAYSEGAKEIGDEILSHEIVKNYLAPEDLLELARYAQGLGMQAGISFFDSGDMSAFGDGIEAFDFLKVPSVEMSNVPFIDRMLATGKHTFISTGCHSEDEVVASFSRLVSDNWTPLHCISNYPAALYNARLGYLRYLQDRWKRPVGYSSHDERWEVCLLAMQLGATVIERHLTFDKAAEGLDHSTSSTPDEFASLHEFAENLPAIMAGNGPRVVNQGELLNRQNLGRSFYASRDIACGERLLEEDLVYRSPKIGIGIGEIHGYLGKATSHDVRKGEVISPATFETRRDLTDGVIDFARQTRLSLPVRLHDQRSVQDAFPIGAYEFHLSFTEVRSEIDISAFDRSNRYSVHLPDYAGPTQLVDPFSPDAQQRTASLEVIDRTVAFVRRLQDHTGREVPVVGSFSVVHADRDRFFADHAALLQRYNSDGVLIMPQWLPPVAWYFGGSVLLPVMNELNDAKLLRQHDLPVCMDVSHLLLGKNYFDLSVADILATLGPNIRHAHIADAAGFDGEGVQIGEGEAENLDIIADALNYDCIKVIEVWQGHLHGGAGFRTALDKLEKLGNGRR